MVQRTIAVLEAARDIIQWKGSASICAKESQRLYALLGGNELRSRVVQRIGSGQLPSTTVATAKILRRFDTVALAITAVSLLSLVFFSYRWSKNGFFWDLAVYRRAVADYNRNVDPYRTDVVLPFVYHPLVLRLFALMNGILPLRVSLPLLELAAFAWFAFEFLQATLPREAPGNGRSPRILAAMAAGAFGGIGVPAFMAGNITSFMHFALIASLLHSRRVAGVPSACLPYGLILLFALVKPYFLIFLAVLVLLSASRTIALACSAAVVLVVAAAWLSSDFFRPAEFARFNGALQSQILDKGDLGYSFFGVVDALTHRHLLALALHAAACSLLSAAVLLLFARKHGCLAEFAPRLFLTYLVLTLANPRMKDYDLFPALIGFFVVFGLAPRAAALGTLAALLLTLVPLAAPLFQELSARYPPLFDPYGTWQDVGLMVIGVVFVMLERRRATAPRCSAE